MSTLTYEVVLTQKKCGECGVTFAVPTYFDEECHATGKGWYCPNGHSRVYIGETHKAKAARLEQEKIALEGERTRLANDAKLLRNEVWEKQEKLTHERAKRLAIQKKIRNGVCPECNRSFSDLKRHMATKHGDPADRKHASQKEKATRCKHK